jgi:hypothetical protein
MNPMRRTWLFFVLTAVHLAVTIGLLLFVFGAGMARFDTGGEPAWFEALCGRLLNLLMFPVSMLLDTRMGQRFPGWWGYVPFVANSALWAAAGLGAFRIVRGLRTKPRTGQTTWTR